MADPRFREAVVLLLEHGEQGTLGVIINRATDLTLARVLPDLKVPGKVQHTLYFGGPVGLSTLLFLIRSDNPPSNAEQVLTGVYYSGERATLEAVLARRAGSDRLRLYVGHSGWAPGQLDAEVAQGDWSLIRADADTLFEEDIETIWPEMMERLPPPGIFIHSPQPRGHTVVLVPAPMR